MADAAALASIAKSALQLFTSLAKDESLLLWNSQKDLRSLEATIKTLTYIHQDTQERGFNEDAVQDCLSRMRNVMYDAEDFFDTLAARILHKRTMSGNSFTKEVRLFFSDANQLGLIYKTAHAVKEIRESVDDIKKDMELYGLIRKQPPVVQPFVRPKTHSFVHEDDVIGRDEDRDRIISMLLPQNIGETSETRSPSVIAIIGFGGLGKTTLAKYVYNHERVKQGFDVLLWACINYLPNLEQVLREIIASKVEKKQLDLSIEMLQEKLREIIGGKKFLLVLDDVWDENSRNWLDLETIFRCGKSSSKVLVTTRSREVAKCLNALEPYCDLKEMSDESAWSLFVKRVFQGEQPSKCPELERIGKKILGKCGNVPLAIVMVGRLLSQKRRDKITWREFYERKLKGIISSGDEKSIKQVLMVSYNDLHPNLKLCFAVCSLFPKDYIFDKDRLVRLWLAQGIIRPSANNEEQSLEEVGEAYFFNLVDRCFLQQVKCRYAHDSEFYYEGYNWKECIAKMHDLLHDLAMDVVKTENLFLDKVPENKGKIDGLRHISIDFELENSFDCCSMVSDPKTVRTLLFCPKQEYINPSLRSFSMLHIFNPLVQRFTMLRTLDLAYLGVDAVPESIGRLIHLRYLDLGGNIKLKHLPDSICRLHHLMIFVLQGCKLLEKLPRRMEKLVSLRQLLIGGCDNLNSLPSGVKMLTSLVNLGRLIVDCRDGGLRYLKDLDNLAGVLRIELPAEGWLDAIEDAKKANMATKNKLNELVIEWKQRPAATSEQKMAKEEAKSVLEALRPHEKLEYLRICNYGGEMLSRWFWTLKDVKQLCLEGCDQVEYLEDGINGHFCLPSLKLINILSMRNLQGWWKQEIAQGTNRSHLSTVSNILIRDCPKLKGKMPLFERIESLGLFRVHAEVVEEILVPYCSYRSSFSSPLYNNSKLKDLRLSRIEGLTDLPEEWIRHLTALQTLIIEDCRDLKRVSRRGLTHLTALTSLSVESGEIGDEDDIMGSEAGMPWKALQGLLYLKFGVGVDRNLLEGLQYITSLQNLRMLSIGLDNETFHLSKSGILHLPSLDSLVIADCKDLYLSWKTLLSKKLLRLTFARVERVINVEDDMTTVVEQQNVLRELVIIGGAGAKWVDDLPWISLSSSLRLLELTGMGEREQLSVGIQHLTSLNYLIIEGCEKLRSLPVWITKLTSLRILSIRDCSEELQRRCERGMGEDWPLIRHVKKNTVLRSTNLVELANELRNEEEEGSRKKGGCTPCWSL